MTIKERLRAVAETVLQPGSKMPSWMAHTALHALAEIERMELALRLVQDALHMDACEYDDVRAMLTTIEQALSTSQPVETAEQRNERRAFALYHHEHGECAADIARAEWAEETDAVQNEYRDMARAIAESDKARKS